jgi:hypothetical protein
MRPQRPPDSRAANVGEIRLPRFTQRPTTAATATGRRDTCCSRGRPSTGNGLPAGPDGSCHPPQEDKPRQHGLLWPLLWPPGRVNAGPCLRGFRFPPGRGLDSSLAMRYSGTRITCRPPSRPPTIALLPSAPARAFMAATSLIATTVQPRRACPDAPGLPGG